jgi:hypothetical protein
MAEKSYTNFTPFRWNRKRDFIAEMLAAGYTIRETAEAAGVSISTVNKYKARPDFEDEVDRLTLMVDLASRADRVRVAKRIIRERLQAVEARNKEIAEGKSVKPLLSSDKDILDWLKYIQSETDGVRLFTGEQLDTIRDAYFGKSNSRTNQVP